MKNTNRVTVNLAVSIEARQRLETMAARLRLPLGTVLDRAILAYKPGVESGSDILQERIEMALQPFIDRLTVLERGSHFKAESEQGGKNSRTTGKWLESRLRGL